MNILLRNAREWLQTSTWCSFYAVLKEAKITPRQMQVCEMKFVNGKTNYQIAMEMNISVKTVEKDLSTAYNAINKVLLK